MKMQRGSIFRLEHDYYKIVGIVMMICLAFNLYLAVNLAETQFPRWGSVLQKIQSMD